MRADQLGGGDFDLDAGPARSDKPDLREPPKKPKPKPKPAPGAEAPDYLKRLMEAKKRAKDRGKGGPP